MNSLEVVLGIATIVMSIAAAAFAWRLHRAGTPRDQLARQVGLKAGGIADTLRDKIVEVMAEESAKMAASAGLRTAYFDEADFVMDVGRLPAQYTKAVSLDGKLVRNGNLPGDVYIRQANGNVTRA